MENILEKIKENLPLFPEESILFTCQSFDWIEQKLLFGLEYKTHYIEGFMGIKSANYLFITNKRIIICFGYKMRISIFFDNIGPLSTKEEVSKFQYHENYGLAKSILEKDNNIQIIYTITGIGPVVRWFSKFLDLRIRITLNKIDNEDKTKILDIATKYLNTKI